MDPGCNLAVELTVTVTDKCVVMQFIYGFLLPSEDMVLLYSNLFHFSMTALGMIDYLIPRC